MPPSVWDGPDAVTTDPQAVRYAGLLRQHKQRRVRAGSAEPKPGRGYHDDVTMFQFDHLISFTPICLF